MKWSVHAGGAIGNPIVAGGTVFVTGVDGSLHAFDPDGSVHLARANGWIYPYLASATPQTTGAHQLQLMVSGTGPVHLAILVDGNPILDFTDDQPGAIEAPGSTGLFSWQGAGPTYQHFIAVQP